MQAALLTGAVCPAPQIRPRACEISRIYRGHEVAAHTLTHPRLTELPDGEFIRRVVRFILSGLMEYDVKGMAYPCGFHATVRQHMEWPEMEHLARE